MFKTTIKAKVEYIVKKARDKRDGKEYRVLFDGDEMIMAAYPLSLNDHYYHAENNECYHVLERFTTRSGANFIYSRDEELDADYLVKV